MNRQVSKSANTQMTNANTTTNSFNVSISTSSKRGLMMKNLTLLKTFSPILLTLVLLCVAFLIIAPVPALAQGGSAGSDGALVVTNTMYIDTDRYAVTEMLVVGSNRITATTAMLGLTEGDEILIITMQGPTTTVVGTYETAVVNNVSGTVLTTTAPRIRSHILISLCGSNLNRIT